MNVVNKFTLLTILVTLTGLTQHTVAAKDTYYTITLASSLQDFQRQDLPADNLLD